MDVVRDHAELRCRPVETPWLGQRAAGVIPPALPMFSHCAQPELVVPGMALVDLGLVDQVGNVVGAMAGQSGNGTNFLIILWGCRQSLHPPPQRPAQFLPP